MRERTRSEDIKVGSYEQQQFEGSDGCTVPYEEQDLEWYVSHQGAHVEVQRNEIMHDIVTPNFHKLRSQGKIINSPMDRTITVNCDYITSVVSSHGYQTYDDNCADPVWKRHVTLREGTRPSSLWTGGVSNMLPQPSINVSSLISQAVTSAHANVSQTDIQSMVFVAEGQKSVLSLVSIFKRLIKIIRMLKKLDAKGLIGELTPKELSDRYMEVRYALRPLMYDAIGIHKALTKAYEEDAKRVTFRGFASATESETDESNYFDGWSGWSRNGIITKTAQRTVEVRAGVLTEVYGNTGLMSWGLVEPIESIWELVPFSFIIDWFFNFGNTISSWTPEYGISELSSWYTVKDVSYRDISITDTHGLMPDSTETYIPDFNDFSLGTCLTSELITQVYRVPNPKLSIIPRFSLNLDMFKLADLLIIAQKLWMR